MNDISIKLIITPPVGKPTELVLESCIVSGIMGDGSKAPMGGFFGSLNSEKLIISMIHVIRAFIKANEEQLNVILEIEELKNLKINREKQLKKMREMVQKIIDCAFEIEEKNRAEDNIDLDTHVISMRFDKSPK